MPLGGSCPLSSGHAGYLAQRLTLSVDCLDAPRWTAAALLHEDPAGVGAVWPALLVTLRRSHTTGMQSKVHPTYKTKYRVANWAVYNQAFVRRGDVTVWLSSEAIAAWTPAGAAGGAGSGGIRISPSRPP